jgi:hypothetical protein
MGLLLTAGAAAQVDTARLSGTISDPSGAVIPNAQVTATNKGTGQATTVQASSSGAYTFPSLPPGSYTLSVQETGFAKFEQTGINLTVSQQATLDVQLKTGAAGETVTVTGDTALINTTNAEVSNTVGERAIRELPLNGRDPSSLVLLSPGTVNVLNTGGGTQQGETTFPNESGASAGGGRQGSTLYLLDGVSNMDTYQGLGAPSPNADATGEFRVISNNFDARYGFSPGAVVNIETKAGTNDLHGGIFEFLRNNDLNAANYFSKQVDPLKRNQFGGFLGGPVLKNKLFIFGNYQGTRQSSASTANTANTPTAAMLAGDFSAVPMTLGGPFATVNGKPNQVNPALYDPAAVQVVNAVLPLGQDPSSGLVYYTVPATRERFDEGTGRIDWAINDRQRLLFRSFDQYYNRAGSATPGNFLAINPGKQGKFFNELLSHTWTISNSMVNTLSVFWTQENVVNSGAQLDKSGNAFCLSKYIAVNEVPGSCFTEGFGVSGGFGGPYSETTSENRHTWGLSETFTKTLGNHVISAGADVWKQSAKELSLYPSDPIVNFNGYYTGFGLADLLLGKVGQFTQGAGEVADVTGYLLGVYAQDQYRVRPNLTVTAGLRWDPNLAPASKAGRGTVWEPGAQSTAFPNAPAGLLFPGDPGVPDSLIKNTYGYFEPRIAIAYQVNPKTAIRAGLGLFTAPLPYSLYNHVADISPFSPTYTFYGSNTQTIQFSNPYANFAATGGVSPFPPFAYALTPPPANSVFPSQTTVPATFRPDFKVGITQSWNASIEQQFGANLVTHLAYVGSQSYHQAIAVDSNPGQTATAVRGIRPNAAFGQVLTTTSLGTSSYHSLQAQLEKRLSHNFQIQSSFTWSKTIDLSSSGNVTFGNPQLADPYDVRYNRGISDLSFPFVSVTNGVYTTPSLHNWNGFVRGVLGEWEISAIYTLQSGRPFSISGGGSANNSGALQYLDRADFVPGVLFNTKQGSREQWLNQYFTTAAFQENAPGTFGDTPRNFLRGPGVNYSDAALIKNWSAHERYHLQFRWEMFNVFNHTSFGLPDTNPSSGTYGRITGVGSVAPRVQQAGLKLTF